MSHFFPEQRTLMNTLTNSADLPPPDRDQVVSILRDLKRELGAALGIVELGIFGSVARGSATPASDLDVYVTTETPNPYLLVRLKEAIEGRVRRRVDLVRLRERMNPLLKARIERDGIHV